MAQSEGAGSRSQQPGIVGNLSSYRPRARQDVEVSPAADGEGRFGLRTRDGTCMEQLDEAQLRLWKDLDGDHSLEQLTLAGMSWPQPVGPSWVAATVARLARARLLVDSGVGPAGRRSTLLVALAGPWALAGKSPALRTVGHALFGLVPLAGLAFVALAVRQHGFSLMPPRTGPWWLLLWVLAGLTVVEAAKAMAHLAAGRPLSAVGVGRVWGLPVLTFEAPGVSPSERALPAFWGLGAAALLCGAGASGAYLSDCPWSLQLMTVAAVLLVLDLGPLFASSGRALLAAWRNDAHVTERAISFTMRRLVPRMLHGQPLSPEEGGLVLSAALIAVWAVAALRFATLVFGASLPGFSSALGFQANLPTQFLGIAMVLAFLGGLIFALVRVVLTPVRLLASAGLRGEPIARWMFVASLVAAAATTAMPPHLLALCYVLALGATLVWLRQQYLAIPGSRLGLGYRALSAGLLAGLFSFGLSALWVLGAVTPQLLPPAVLAVSEWLVTASLVALGLAELAELAQSRGRPARWVVPAVGLAGVVLLGATAAGWPGALLGVAVGLAPLGAAGMLLDRAGTPMHNFWRPFAGAALLLASAQCLRFGGTGAGWVLEEASGLPALGGLQLQVAGLLMVVGALLASRAMFAVPMPARQRPPAVRAGATELEALWDGGSHVLEGVLDIARFFLGDGRHRRILDALNERLGDDPDFPLKFDEKRVTPAVASLPESPSLERCLRRGLRVLESQVVASAGRRFFERALAVSTQSLFWLESEMFRRCLRPEESGPATGANLMEELSRMPLFGALSGAQLEELIRVLRRESFEEGAAVVRQGEPGDRFYIVARGMLEVVREDASGFPVPLAELGEGDCFGEMALLGGGVRTASVQARSPVDLISLGKSEFERFVADREYVTSVIRHSRFLQMVPLLSSLPPALLAALAPLLQPVEATAGEAVVHRGATLDRLWMVREGTLTSGPQSWQAGEVFGQEGLLGAATAAEDLVTADAARLVTLSYEALSRTIRGWLDRFESCEQLAARQTVTGWDLEA